MRHFCTKCFQPCNIIVTLRPLTIKKDLDGSYLRLNTLTLGYTLPKSMLQKAGISNLRVYGSIYNVFTITGYSGIDAEVSTSTSTKTYPQLGMDWGTYPRARSFVLGVNLSF